MRDKHSELLVERIVDALSASRKEMGISHEKLAEKTGLSRPAISFIESHKRMPTILSCLKISKALGLKLSDIIGNLEK